jgi:hypothetical protein
MRIDLECKPPTGWKADEIRQVKIFIWFPTQIESTIYFWEEVTVEQQLLRCIQFLGFLPDKYQWVNLRVVE